MAHLKLTKKQKDIVKNIANGNITDIYSFVKHYNLGYEIYTSEDEVEAKFNELYKDKTYICDSKTMYLSDEEYKIETIDQTTVKAKACLSFRNTGISLGRSEVSYSYSYFKKIYATENMQEIISFLALWQYLNAQSLIAELPKKCSKNDFALFIRKAVHDHDINIFEPEEGKKYDFEYLRIDALGLLNYYLILDGENFDICYPYLNKKIYPAPELNTFIQNDFNTTEELNNRRNLWIAFAGIIIAIFTSLASIIISINQTDYKQELQAISNSLQEIQEVLIHRDQSVSGNMVIENGD